MLSVQACCNSTEEYATADLENVSELWSVTGKNKGLVKQIIPQASSCFLHRHTSDSLVAGWVVATLFRDLFVGALQ